MTKTTSKVTTKTNTKPINKPVTKNATKVTTKKKETKPKSFVGAKYTVIKMGTKTSTVHNIMLLSVDQAKTTSIKDIDSHLKFLKTKVFTKEKYDGEKQTKTINTYVILDGTDKDFKIFTRIVNLFVKEHCNKGDSFKMATFVANFSKVLFEKHEEIKANKVK